MYPNLWRQLQKQAACYSHKPFATYGREALSFEQLTADVKRLATFLGCNTNQPVIGIKLTGPLQNITGILATLVAGKAFWTTHEELLEKTEAQALQEVFVLDQQQYEKGLSPDDQAFKFKEEFSSETAFCWATSSGSLATPKITEHSYESLMEDTFRQVKAHDIGPEDRIDIISALSFSASLSSLFPALLTGASLHIYDNSALAITGIYQFWKSERITMTTIIPTMFRPLLNYQYDFNKLDIRFICIGGEPVYPNDIALFQQKFPEKSKLQIAVASSEARSIAEYITGTQDAISEEGIRYSPVSEKELSIVDEDGKPRASGETGRIAITSKIIGTRYVQGPDNFSETEDGRHLFISDDLGSLDTRGQLILHKAERSRLKLKGEFIDLGQLEQRLLKAEGIEDCRLHLSDRGAVLSIIIQSMLKKPEVRKLVTAVLKTNTFRLYVLKQELPKTHSGKPDFALLRTLIRDNRSLEYSDRDLTYYEQWKQVFPAESDFEGKHFFNDLGGDSITAATLATGLCAALDVEMEPNAIYLYPHYEELANYLKNARPYQLKCLGEYDDGLQNILFFPSLNGVHAHFLPVVDLLRGEYNAFLIQHPPGSGKRYESPDSMAQKCARMLEASPYEFSCFIGHSFSGYLAYHTAHHYKKVAGVLLLDTHTYKTYGAKRKKLVNALRAAQVLYQHASNRDKLRFYIRRRLLLTNRSSGTHRENLSQQPESPMQVNYNDFFRAFSQTKKELPHTNFPLAVFRATNATNIRYRLEYDFRWDRYNTNIKLNKMLKGEHESLLRSEENVRVVANALDSFIKAHC